MKSISLTLLLVCISTNVLAQSTGYIWPTDASPYLSSTFAETRSAHFHAGLDIKTWGQEGYKVFASKRGKIVRMAIASQGYGRALYMQHDDGYYTVYAHLQRFIPKLQAYIDSVRLLDHVFEIDLNVESENWWFEQGDVIGYSGSTGIGPPHLHFEIRDENEHPINPLLTNLEIKDTIAPKISAILAIPMSDTTLIEGSKFPRLYYPSLQSDGTLSIDLIRANGPIAFAINEYDQADDVTNKYASYEFKLESEEGVHFYSKHGEFNFNEASTMFVDRIAAYGAYRRSYQTLFDEELAGVPFYQSSIRDGIINPTDTLTSFTISVNDIHGNQTTVQLELIQDYFKSSFEVKPNPDIFQWYWRNDWLTQHSLLSIDLRSSEFGINWNSSKNQHLGYFAGYEMLFTRVIPEHPSTIKNQNFNLKAHFNSDTFFDTTSIGIFTGEKEGYKSFSVMPFSTPVSKEYFIEFYLGSEIDVTQKYGLFHYNPFRDRYTYVDSKLIGNTIHATPDVLGEFVVIPDNAAPTIDNVRIIKTDYGSNFIYVDVTDELTGVDIENSEIQVNGIRGITEFDFEEDKLIYIHPDFIPESRNRIEVIVTDNAGNSRFEVFYR